MYKVDQSEFQKCTYDVQTSMPSVQTAIRMRIGGTGLNPGLAPRCESCLTSAIKVALKELCL